jgi:hypothetical protein
VGSAVTGTELEGNLYKARFRVLARGALSRARLVVGLGSSSSGKLLAIEPELQSEDLKSSSERSLGFVFAAACCLLGTWPFIRGESPRYWLILIACGFAVAAVFDPHRLRPLNVVWTRLGMLLHRIVSPIVMCIVFFLVLTPIAWIMRARGKDPLRLRREPNAESYWIERQPPGPDPQSMVRQF